MKSIKPHGKHGYCQVPRCKGKKCNHGDGSPAPLATPPQEPKEHPYKERFLNIYRLREIFHRKQARTKGIELMDDSDWKRLGNRPARSMNFLKFSCGELFLDVSYKDIDGPAVKEIIDLTNLDHLYVPSAIYDFLFEKYNQIKDLTFSEDYTALVAKTEESYFTIMCSNHIHEKLLPVYREKLSDMTFDSFPPMEGILISSLAKANPKDGAKMALDSIAKHHIEDMFTDEAFNTLLGKNIDKAQISEVWTTSGDTDTGYALIAETKEDPFTLFPL